MLWLALYFPQLALEVQTNAASLAEQTAGDHPRHTRQGSSPSPRENQTRPQVLVAAGRVLLRNAVAATAGIELGTTLATAHSIAPQLHYFQDQPEHTAQRLRQLAELLYPFSSQIALVSPDALLLESQRSLKLFSNLDTLVEKVLAACRALRHQVYQQTASTPLAALALARSGATDIKTIPLVYTPIDITTQNRLSSMGIRYLGPLLDLPEAELGERFGLELLDYLQRLTGRQPDPREYIIPAPTFSSSVHLLDAARQKSALLFPMQRLLLELECWLIGRQLGALKLLWVFKAYRARVTMSVAFATPQQRKGVLFDISQLQFSNQTLPDEVLDIHLQVPELRPCLAENQSLFATDKTANTHPATTNSANLSLLVDQLRARLGQDICYGIQPVDQHCPEQAWQKIHPGSIPERHSNTPSPAINDHFRGRRPLWLFNRPHPIKVTQFQLIYGPERIQTRWWEDAIQRDYYIAEHRGGARCWVFLDARDRWYLHGYFG